MDVLKTYFAPARVGAPASPKGKAAVVLEQQQLRTYSLRRLTLIFAAWKTLLLVLACASPGPGYDTSTQILLDQYGVAEPSWFSSGVEHLVLRLTRWDAIYFASGSLRGQVYEQEWAFSWAMSKATSFFAEVCLKPLSLSSIVKHALAGVFLSHFSHLFAVFALYTLTRELIPSSETRRTAIAFTAASLHIFSPAGIFLSAPYGESAFACLSFAGTLCYIQAAKSSRSQATQRLSSSRQWKTRSGFVLGLAAMVRSNGLLNGIPFAWDVFASPNLWQDQPARPRAIGQLLSTVVAGALVGMGFMMPQFVAFTEYCLNGNTRPWCTRFPPSIYNWVQEHYWEVGLFKYWTLNNLPLFLLAAPMLVVLSWTGYIALRRAGDLAVLAQAGTGKKDVDAMETDIFVSVVFRLALPQLLLALLAATSFHVQIVNRVSSGYAVWYIVLAIVVHAPAKDRNQLLGALSADWACKWVVRAMVVYAIVQAGLFASFLPPA